MKAVYHFFLLAVILLSLNSVTHAQQAAIRGTVTDSRGNPLSHVNVIVKGTKLGNSTDEKGEYLIRRVRSGTYTLEISHIGYKREELQVVVHSGDKETAAGTVRLQMSVNELGTIIVSATRSERNAYEVSRPVNIVPEYIITGRNSKTSAEALREEAGIFVQKTNHGGGSAIIRGLSSNRILLQVDGIRLNNSTYRLGNHQYLTTVDNNLVNRIEVVRGPTSVLYGSDALGGTINLISKKPDLMETSGGRETRVNGLARYASADGEQTAHAGFSVVTDKTAFLGGLTYKKFGDLRRGENGSSPLLENSANGAKQSPSGYDEYNYDAKFIREFTPEQEMVVAFQRMGQDEVPRYDKYESGSNVQWLYAPQKRTLAYIKYSNDNLGKMVSSFQLTLSYQMQEEGRITQKKYDSDITKELDNVKTYGALLQCGSRLSNHIWTYGVDMYYDRIGSERFNYSPDNIVLSKDERGRYIDGSRYNSFGLFLQDEMRIIGRLFVTPGLRYSYFTTEFPLPEDQKQLFASDMFEENYTSLTADIGLSYALKPHLHLNGNVSQGFRAPNLSDLSKFGESKGNIYEVPNFLLKPEKIISYDAGFKTDFQRLKSFVSVYYSRITDIIESADDRYDGSPYIDINGTNFKVKSKQNIGKAEIYGLEAGATAVIAPAFQLYGNICYTYGQILSLDEPSGGIPPMFGLAGLQWEYKNRMAEVYVRFASLQDRLSADDLDDPRIPPGGTPSWSTLNFRTRFHVNDYLKIRFAVENILDKNYREHGSGINGPGRNFIIGTEFIR